jgi:glycerophosphoryl diester phosphodiesterase
LFVDFPTKPSEESKPNSRNFETTDVGESRDKKMATTKGDLVNNQLSNHLLFSGWERKKRPLVVGHRGGSQKYQENTMKAFKEAYQNGLDGVEMDVYISKDGHAFIFHDDDTERLTGIKGIIYKMTAEEISKLRIKKVLTYDGVDIEYESDEPIPRFEEVLEEFQGKDFLFDVELKPSMPSWSQRHFGKTVAQILRKYKFENQCIVTSFDFFKVNAAESEFPPLVTGYAYDDDMGASLGNSNTWHADVDEKTEKFPKQNTSILHWVMETGFIDRAIGTNCVALEHTVIDSDTIEKFHKRGMAVGVYTIFPTDVANVKRKYTKEEMINILKRTYERKVNWIETDDGVLALKLLEEWKAEGQK